MVADQISEPSGRRLSILTGLQAVELFFQSIEKVAAILSPQFPWNEPQLFFPCRESRDIVLASKKNKLKQIMDAKANEKYKIMITGQDFCATFF